VPAKATASSRLGPGAAYEGQHHRESENGPTRVSEGPAVSMTAPLSYTGSRTAASEKSCSHTRAEAAVSGASRGAAAYDTERDHECKNTWTATGATADTRTTAPSETTATTADDGLHHDQSVSAHRLSGVDVMTTHDAVGLGGRARGRARRPCIEREGRCAPRRVRAPGGRL
jgi:hypothetical protein